MDVSRSTDAPRASAPKTYFAPPERAEQKAVDDLSEFVRENALFEAIEQTIDGYLMVLNPQRQILAVNPDLATDLGLGSSDCLIGKRPGEALSCIHAQNGPGGCGTAPACATCGAVIAILQSQDSGAVATGECLATVRRGSHNEALELRVRATPFRLGAHVLTALVFQDISGDKRRQALERTFFHDILNTIGGLMGWSSLLARLEGLDPKEVAGRILDLSRRLKREIQDQRRLSQAEHGSLALELETTSVKAVLETLDSVFAAHEAAKGKEVLFERGDSDLAILTDASLLVRVLTNMVKNALEAIPEGEQVRLWHEQRNGEIAFFVHNPGAIPDKVAQRIFQRSFSTKGGSGRGIGTYSMKLFGERYLGGKVAFSTSAKDGTIFSIQLPLDGPPKREEKEGK